MMMKDSAKNDDNNDNMGQEELVMSPVEVLERAILHASAEEEEEEEKSTTSNATRDDIEEPSNAAALYLRRSSDDYEDGQVSYPHGSSTSSNDNDNDNGDSPKSAKTESSSLSYYSEDDDDESACVKCHTPLREVRASVLVGAYNEDHVVESFTPTKSIDTVVTNAAASTKREKSCVDCGGCTCCCCCYDQENANATMAVTPQRKNRGPTKAYSVLVGKVPPAASSTRTIAMELSSSYSSSADQQGISVQKLKESCEQKEENEADRNETTPKEGGGDDQHNDDMHLAHVSGNGWSAKWSSYINQIRIYTCRLLRWITHYAASYPKACIALTAIVSFTLLIIGLCTNFHVETENYRLWPPRNSLSIQHTNWYYYNSQFNYDTSYFDMVVHAQGDNVLNIQGIRRTFEAMDAIRDIEGYKDGCAWARMFGDDYYVGECKIHSVADFWNESQAIFEEQVQTDQDAIEAMSAEKYPNGIFVDEGRIFGNAVRVSSSSYNGGGGYSDDDLSHLERAEAFLIEFDLPWTNVTADFEWTAIQRIQQLQEEWKADPDNPYRVELSAYRSYSDEFFRAIIKDLPLLPCVFTVMSLFCCFVFWKRDRVQSRMLLGIGAVVCIFFSIISGYGLLFIFGVSFTPVTTMMPFLMFGIGLDDAFIIYGSYNRTDPRLDPALRIQQTIDDVGLSISLTTLTSTLAFFMGVFSNIPAVSWVCWYAFPTIVIDFIYQITFFIALIVLDERRIQANNKDVCFWSRVHDEGSEATSEESDDNSRPPSVKDSSEDPAFDVEKNQPTPKHLNQMVQHQPQPHFADRFMHWFAKQLLKPTIQATVIVLFLFIFGGSVYSSTRLRQQFNYIDLVPDDSYLKDYYGSLDAYTQRNGLYVYVFFRDVDQSDPEIQDQMEQYLEDMVQSDAIAQPPVYFWLRDFKAFVEADESLAGLTFEEQILDFFADPGWKDLYGEHVVVNENKTSPDYGKVIESRCIAYVDVDLKDSIEGTQMLETMRAVASRQPINQGRDEWAFLTYNDDYHLMEFYAVVVQELIFTTIMGVAAVSVIALVFIPHWSAICYVFPFISFLYIDMLGFLQLSGVQINAISYITLVMSIGLMVDFIMHILLRYFESKGTREQKVVETLSTMGASILLSAMSTFLGVLLLAFSTSVIINNIFVSFIGLVAFGVLHGLVFLPVVLSMVGPE